MSYEHFLIREQNGEADYQQGDTNCSDCNQQICACESLSDWHRERDEANSGEDVCVPALSESRRRQAHRDEAYLDQGHLHT